MKRAIVNVRGAVEIVLSFFSIKKTEKSTFLVYMKYDCEFFLPANELLAYFFFFSF